MSKRDRRESDAAADRNLNGKLINAAMGYLNSGKGPDEEFARTVLDGCTAANGSKDYPPVRARLPRQGEVTAMAGRKTSPKGPAKKCTTCDGAGEIRESVRVGARKGRATADQQTGMCPSCWGSGEAD